MNKAPFQAVAQGGSRCLRYALYRFAQTIRKGIHTWRGDSDAVIYELQNQVDDLETYVQVVNWARELISAMSVLPTEADLSLTEQNAHIELSWMITDEFFQIHVYDEGESFKLWLRWDDWTESQREIAKEIWWSQNPEWVEYGRIAPLLNAS